MARLRRVFVLGTVLALASFVVANASAEKLAVGDKAPNFKAQTVDGKVITLGDTKGAKVVVICFTCNKCPIARAYEDRFVEFNTEYADKGVKFIALNVNKGESLEKMKQRSESKKFNFPYAYDETGKSAADYGARVTPHLFILDADGTVAYIGAFDDNKQLKKVKKRYAVAAVDALLKGEKPEITETKAVGCGIKR